MAELLDKIAQAFPKVEIQDREAEFPRLVVDDDQWHEVAQKLKDDFGFDYLVTIVGMDWESEMGCIYFLISTKTNQSISAKVIAKGDRQQPYIHSVYDVWHVAGIYEREVYDFYGIIFVNNPDMRRLFLSIDWKGYPLRKDYNDENPVTTENERQSDDTNEWNLDDKGNLVKKVNKVFQPDDFVVNIGPQHPATHGVLRFRTAIDGEEIKKIDVYMGYIHRGVEKLSENLGYAQTLHFMDRLDYFSAQNYHTGLARLYEKAAGIKVSKRVEVIRTIMDELSRIASHCLFIGTYCMDLGATTMLFYTLRVREQILDIMDKNCGARMTFNYSSIGGLMEDILPDFVQDVHTVLNELPANIKEYNTIFTGNVIAQNRLKNVGNISKEDCIAYGVTGPSGRASGWACDMRKLRPYSVYNEVEFDEIVAEEGDSFARFNCRMKEMEQSKRIIEQLIDNIPEGEIQAPVPKVLKIPAGHWFEIVEGCRGFFGLYLESDGGTKPYRLKIVPPCLPLAAAVDHMTRGQKIADLITIGGSLDYIVPDMDR